MKTSYRVVETFHEGAPILVQRTFDFESYETVGQIHEPVAHATATVCECQELADEVAALRAVGA